MSDMNRVPENMMRILKEMMQDPEQKAKLIESLLDGSSQLKMAAFCNKGTGEMLSLQEFIEREGRDKAREMLEVMLSNMTEENVEVSQIPKDEMNSDRINEILHKVKEGTATEDEQIIAKIFEDEGHAEVLKQANSANMIRVLIGSFAEMLLFANNQVYYNPTFSDYTYALEMVMIASLCATPSSALHKYKDSATENIETIAAQVAGDIKNACTQFWKTQPANPEFIILGLLHWVNELCETHELEFAEAEEILGYYGLAEQWLDDDDSANNNTDTAVPGVTQPICHGSNDGKVVSFTDAQMKNLLKED